MGGMGGGGMQGMGGGMGGMGMGGGMGGMGGGGMGGMGGGMFNVMPEKTQRMKIEGVCLDHGLRDPNPKVPYDLKPMSDYTDVPGVYDLCHMIARKEITQHAAQAAAWHMNNDMSWQELAAKTIHYLDGRSEPYFKRHEIVMAVKAVEVARQRDAIRRAYEAEQKKSSSESTSPVSVEANE